MLHAFRSVEGHHQNALVLLKGQGCSRTCRHVLAAGNSLRALRRLAPGSARLLDGVVDPDVFQFFEDPRDHLNRHPDFDVVDGFADPGQKPSAFLEVDHRHGV